MYAAAILLAFVASAVAITVTEPNASVDWTNKGQQTVKWDAVNTDASNFTIVLTNEDRSVMPDNNQVLAALVDSSLGQTSVGAPSGGWPTGGTFRVNFVKSETDLTTIYAQSPEFNITEDTSSSSSSSSSSGSTTASRSNSATSATGTSTVPPTAVEAGSSGSATASGGATTPSNGASATTFGAAGLAGALAFVGAMLA
ncbi:hypothetical protein BD626DRAFT_502639 [Schizophyllum amplum]|uniref:Yeast cell wall synthesis Kre9/Knh1-like N-terminal domain-containing protein n=1 Tax=Schizophyllum amplum TaxID=97359 RepID=A0A550C8H2_9AGAR|nr:hypothetical protein BD626DRAFT_502639 [Auriculariopsis ampla]